MVLDQGVILIVDDQVTDLRILGQALAGLGSVHMAMDGDSALCLARRCRPDVILLDIDMPLMDGYSVCEEIKNDPRLAQTAVIFVTSHRQTEHELRALKLGGADFLHKPIDLPIARARVEAQILHSHAVQKLAYYDPLTGLANRLLLLDRLGQALDFARDHTTMVALLSVDLENFNALNDAEGHALGDALLQQVAASLEQCCTPADTASRAGGQRFVLLMVSCQSVEEVADRADQLLSVISAPMMIDSVRYDLAANVGISVYPQDGTLVETLYEHADAALYQARESGRGHYHFFNAASNDRVRAHHQLERDLRLAIENHQLEVFYQPQINLQLKRIVGVEALVRWPQTDGTMVLPGCFIPLAEDTGLIVAMGEYVLDMACAALRCWHTLGHEVTVSVNISPVQFRDPDFEAMVARTLARTKAPPDRLELEITEGVLAHNIDETCQILNHLRTLGLSISVDDFGTGYSSMAYLKLYPLDVLKIDQSFVREMLSHKRDGAIIAAIIQLGHALDLQLVAEGVETAEQAEALQHQGCHVLQGYLYSHPLPKTQMTDYLRACSAGAGSVVTAQAPT